MVKTLDLEHVISWFATKKKIKKKDMILYLYEAQAILSAYNLATLDLEFETVNNQIKCKAVTKALMQYAPDSLIHPTINIEEVKLHRKINIVLLSILKTYGQLSSREWLEAIMLSNPVMGRKKSATKISNKRITEYYRFLLA